MTFNQGPVKPSRRWSVGYAATWGPYWDAIFPPREVTAWIDWKRGSTGVNVARRFWEQREQLRRAYEAVHGRDPEAWPSRHPRVVLDAVPQIDHAACLGCRWFDPSGWDPPSAARRHERSDGTGSLMRIFCGDHLLACAFRRPRWLPAVERFLPRTHPRGWRG